MIRDDEITVVFQGPIGGDASSGITRDALASVRRCLPGARVVLSTWKGSEVEGLSFDECVLSDDPGGAYILGRGEAVPTNINRLILSTRAGLARVGRPYALKLRTDYRLAHPGFRRWFEKYPARAAQWRVFEARVVIPDHYARNPRRGAPWLFHPSDVAQFGRTEDLQRFWSAPLLTGRPDDLTPAEAALVSGEKGSAPVTRFYNEQYLWLHSVRDSGAVPAKHWSDAGAELLAISEASLANNFIIVRRDAFGIVSAKHTFEFLPWQSLYTFADWHELYRRYCDAASARPADFAAWLKDQTRMEKRSLFARLLRTILLRSEFLKARV